MLTRLENGKHLGGGYDKRENSLRRGRPASAYSLRRWRDTAVWEGDAIRILNRSPIGHYRVPIYLRGKIGTVEAVIEPTGVNNEEEGFGRNAGSKLHYYRIAVPLSQVWSHYNGSSQDSLRIEVFESWLEGT
jgi:nitrile hydratase subunit beta